MNLRKYLNNQYWNIGFAELTPSQLIETKKLPHINWMKHSYKDRFFADPFILKVEGGKIHVLVEEYEFKPNSKGVIVKLEIDKENYKLIERKELLKLKTHLSYPVIIRENGNVFIMPENSESGFLKIYSLSNEDTLSCEGIVADYPLTDATPIEFDKERYLMSTEFPKSQEDLFLYKFNKKDFKYHKLNEKPLVAGRLAGRMGGSFFSTKGHIYRPAQDCSKGYGKALTIFEVKSFEPSFDERPILRLEPVSWKYNLGLHTLNFDEESGLAVIDSYGYLYPVRGRLMMMLHRIKQLICGRKNN